MPRTCWLSCCALVLLLFTGVQAAEPVRVGVLGLDNYQAVEYARQFNNPKAEGDFAGLKVVAAYPIGSPEIADSLEGLAKWREQIQKSNVELVDSIDELLKRVDCVMIMSLDARDHLKQATPVLKARKRLFIGRPMAANLAETAEIFRIAKENNTPVWSSSQHRFSPGFSGMRNHPEVGNVLGCDVYGGCPTEPHHTELVWHALHTIETMYTIMGPGCVSVSCAATETANVITAVWGDGRIATYRGIKKGALKYSATVFGDKGVSTAGIYGHGVPVAGIVPKSDKYMGYEGIGAQMAMFFKTGKPPVEPSETIEIFKFIEAAHQSKAQGGAVVKLDSIATK